EAYLSAGAQTHAPVVGGAVPERIRLPHPQRRERKRQGQVLRGRPRDPELRHPQRAFEDEPSRAGQRNWPARPLQHRAAGARLGLRLRPVEHAAAHDEGFRDAVLDFGAEHGLALDVPRLRGRDGRPRRGPRPRALILAAEFAAVAEAVAGDRTDREAAAGRLMSGSLRGQRCRQNERGTQEGEGKAPHGRTSRHRRSGQRDEDAEAVRAPASTGSAGLWKRARLMDPRRRNESERSRAPPGAQLPAAARRPSAITNPLTVRIRTATARPPSRSNSNVPPISTLNSSPSR